MWQPLLSYVDASLPAGEYSCRDRYRHSTIDTIPFFAKDIRQHIPSLKIGKNMLTRRQFIQSAAAGVALEGLSPGAVQQASGIERECSYS